MPWLTANEILKRLPHLAAEGKWSRIFSFLKCSRTALTCWPLWSKRKKKISGCIALEAPKTEASTLDESYAEIALAGLIRLTKGYLKLMWLQPFFRPRATEEEKALSWCALPGAHEAVILWRSKWRSLTSSHRTVSQSLICRFVSEPFSINFFLLSW